MTEGLDGRQVGSEVHRLIGELLERGLRQPSASELMEAVNASYLVRESVASYRQAARQRLLGAAAIYFRLFAPRAEWELVGRELALGSGRLDLLFRRGELLVGEEIKSGLGASGQAATQVRSQVERLTAGGVERWGDAFIGLRLINLGAPTRSRLVRAGGESRPLLDSDRD